MNFSDLIPKESVTDLAIVLDIDETCVHTFETCPRKKIDSDRYYEFKLGKDKFSGLLRPFIRDFLFFCFCYFKYVIVWSAGQKRYVHEICNILFDGIPSPHLILSRDDCASHKEGYTKPLIKIRDKIPEITLKNTLILDDREHSFAKNPSNGILSPAYEPTHTNHLSNDLYLKDLMKWFMDKEVVECSDVRILDKTI